MDLIDIRQLLRLLKDIKIRYRRGTAAEWTTKNPVLEDGEPGFERNTNRVKVGDGVHRWSELEYLKADVDLESDDGESLELIYENAKV